MQYKMIVSRAMFDFDLSEKGKLNLQSVRFLTDSMMREKNDVLLVTENDNVQFFLNGATPVARLTREQFQFVAAASRFFGYLPDTDKMPVWLWSDSLQMPISGYREEMTALPVS